jgi:predicted nucleotidyltransferase
MSRHKQQFKQSKSDTVPDEAKQFIKTLRQNRHELAGRYNVNYLGLFGSYIRNEQTVGSDLDILVEFDKTPSLFQFIRLENDLGDLLGVKVDLVMKDSLKPAIGKCILDEVVLV